MKKVMSIAVMLMMIAVPAMALDFGIEYDNTLNKELVSDGVEVLVDMDRRDLNLVCEFEYGILKVKESVGLSELNFENYLMCFESVGVNTGVDIELEVYGPLSIIAGYQKTIARAKGGKYYSYIESNISMDEYEVGAILSHQTANMSVYGGAVYSGTKLKIEEIEDNLKQESDYGLRAGITLNVLDNVDVEASCKLIDETSANVKLKYKF